MIDAQEAFAIARENVPYAKINAQIEYKDLHVFYISRLDLPGEEEYDPFYSVHKETGEFQDFSILFGVDPNKILALFDFE